VCGYAVGASNPSGGIINQSINQGAFPDGTNGTSNVA